MRRTAWLIAALAVVPWTGSARAGEFDRVAAPEVSVLAPLATDPVALVAAGPLLTAGAGPRLESIRYEPRRDREYHHAPSGRSSGVSQLHAGFFDPEDVSSSGVLFGFRGGAAIDDHVQIGVDVDWRYNSEQQAVVVSQQGLPTGGTAQVTRILSRASTNLVPILGYLQLGAGHDLPLSPYVGAGAGYEAYFVSADDFDTGAHFDAEYGGFAWQAWVGAQFGLSARSRLVAEVFVNRAELGRDVDVSGQTYRETVNLDGTGMRFGINWGF